MAISCYIYQLTFFCEDELPSPTLLVDCGLMDFSSFLLPLLTPAFIITIIIIILQYVITYCILLNIQILPNVTVGFPFKPVPVSSFFGHPPIFCCSSSCPRCRFDHLSKKPRFLSVGIGI